MPHAYERYNQFANFVPATYNAALGYPLNPDGTLNPAFLYHSNGGSFYLNGIESKPESTASPAEWSRTTTIPGSHESALPTTSAEMARR